MLSTPKTRIAATSTCSAPCRAPLTPSFSHSQLEVRPTAHIEAGGCAGAIVAPPDSFPGKHTEITSPRLHRVVHDVLGGLSSYQCEFVRAMTLMAAQAHTRRRREPLLAGLVVRSGRPALCSTFSRNGRRDWVASMCAVGAQSIFAAPSRQRPFLRSPGRVLIASRHPRKRLSPPYLEKRKDLQFARQHLPVSENWGDTGGAQKESSSVNYQF